MTLEIVFAPRAKQTFASVTTFIENGWGKAATEKFKQRVDTVIRNVASQPYMFKASPFDHNVRIGLITKQSSFLYQVHDSYIEVLFFWDNRQEPLFH